MTNSSDKGALSSKKFVFTKIASVLWFAMILAAIHYDEPASVLLAMVVVVGSLQITYVGGQAALDAYVGAAVAIANGPKRPAESDE